MLIEGNMRTFILLLFLIGLLNAQTTSGLVAWYKADAGVTYNGSNQVTLWEDQSGNSYNVSQAAGSTCPTYVSSDANINDKPALAFASASTQRLRKRVTGIGLTGNAAATIFVIGYNNGAGGSTGRAVWLGDSSGAAGTVMGASFEDESGTTHPSFRWNNGNERYTSVDPTSYKIFTFVFTTNYGSSKLFVNNVLTDSSSVTNGTNTVTLTNEEFIIGCGRNTSAAFTVPFNGRLAEIMVYNKVLGTTERLATIEYLSCKYFNTNCPESSSNIYSNNFTGFPEFPDFINDEAIQ